LGIGSALQYLTCIESHRHHEYEYDGLHRLAEARRGVRASGGGFTHSTFKRSQQWSLDVLGNWGQFATWAEGDGQEPDGYNDVEGREHTDANELTDRTLPDTTTLELGYDKAGNMREQEVPASGSGTVTIRYTHDAWNRLVKVEYDQTVRANYRYNGLNWRPPDRETRRHERAAGRRAEPGTADVLLRGPP
jgi:YD repeat-containing protein